jgi:hypothetical protein
MIKSENLDQPRFSQKKVKRELREKRAKPTQRYKREKTLESSGIAQRIKNQPLKNFCKNLR